MVGIKTLSWLCQAILIGTVVAAPIENRQAKNAGPIVDLGYEIHVGTINSTGNYISFENVPYAEQPVGERRFEKPVGVSGLNPGRINNGSEFNFMCPQAHPQWVIEILAKERGIDNTTMAQLLRGQPGQHEGCLYLDIHVPSEVFYQKDGGKAPVLVWIHGGGFTFGSKNMYGNPAGLIARSKRDGLPGIVVVTINYRLGLFGFLGADIDGNLGLHDQRRALIWLQQFVNRFGGDPDRVVLMGESAGAASILHHMTAWQLHEFPLFHGAIVMSPAFQYNLDVFDTYIKTLEAASVILHGDIKDKDDMLMMQTEQLREINQAVVGAAAIGQFGYGPTPDGDYIGDIPQVGLHYGRVDPSLQVLIGHTSNETVPFLPPPSTFVTDTDVRNFIAKAIPQANNDTLNELFTSEHLYPTAEHRDPRVKYPWNTQYERAARLITDVEFNCATQFVAKARFNETYHYVFGMPPGWHAGDVPYVFYNGDNTTLDNGVPVNATMAYQLQDYIVDFAAMDNPNGVDSTLPRKVPWPVYGPEAKILKMDEDGFREGVDDLMGERCDWIQMALVDGRL